QAAYLLEGLQGQEGVALAHFRQVPAVQQLQELDGEFDVVDAAVTGLDLRVTGSCLSRLLFDAPLQGFDLIDFSKTQVFAVHKGLNTLEKGLAQPEISRDGPQLDQGLPLPGAAERVIVGKRTRQG